MLYRLMARIKSGFRWLRFHMALGVEYHRYGADMPVWEGWYEANGWCLAYKGRDGALSFRW